MRTLTKFYFSEEAAQSLSEDCGGPTRRRRTARRMREDKFLAVRPASKEASCRAQQFCFCRRAASRNEMLADSEIAGYPQIVRRPPGYFASTCCDKKPSNSDEVPDLIS